MSRPGPWVAFAVRRLAVLVASLAIVLAASFLMIHLIPGDPVRGAAGVTAPPEFVAQRRAQLGLDDPLLDQFINYAQSVLSFDFGESFTTQEPVSEIIRTRMPNSAKLGGVAFVLTMGVSIPFGVVMGALTEGGRHRRTEFTFNSATGLIATIPEFLLAVALVFAFAVSLRWLPVAGAQHWYSYILPAFAIAMGPTAALTRIVRSETLKVLSQDYMRTAHSKRLPRRLIYMRHALPNLLTATLTIGGLLFGALIGGSVVVENVFAWPGLGTEAVKAVIRKDYPVVQALVFLLGATVLITNLVVDVVLAILDPRSIIRSA